MNNEMILYADKEQLLKVFRSLYTLTKLKIGLFDCNRNLVLSYPEGNGSFCELIRRNEEQNLRCVLSDKMGFDKVEKDNLEYYAYTCHAGLNEIVVPLRKNGSILGYFMFGQMLSRNADAKRNELINKYDYITNDHNELVKAVNEITINNDPNGIDAAIEIIKICFEYLSNNKIIFSEKSTFKNSLDEYIQKHIPEKIAVEDMCAYFGMKRTSFYTYTKEVLGESIMTYIRKARIEMAKKLLLESDISLQEISEATGFEDYNYFLRSFKRETGYTCISYRKNQV